MGILGVRVAGGDLWGAATKAQTEPIGEKRHSLRYRVGEIPTFNPSTIPEKHSFARTKINLASNFGGAHKCARRLRLSPTFIIK